MTMSIQKGNLIEAAVNGDVSHIMHGCNCFHAMGSGIAGTLASRFPEIPEADQRTPLGSVAKLATFSLAKVTYEKVQDKSQPGWQDKPAMVRKDLVDPFHCINLYTQYQPGPDFLPSLFPSAIAHVNEVFSGKTIGIPLIGCGIASGDWQYVMGVLLTQGKDIDWEVYVL